MEEWSMKVEEFIAGLKLDRAEMVDISKLHPTVDIYLTEDLFPRFKDGIKVPILVNKKTNIIEDGNHRYYAAKKLGLKQMPVIYTDDIPNEFNIKAVNLVSKKLEQIWMAKK
jgi:hypothetical protein